MATISEIQELFEGAEQLPTKPSFEDFPIYVMTDVIDEDKTVKWNREEIKKRMEARNAETIRLREFKKAAIQDAHQKALNFISESTGMTHKQSMILWNFIISNYPTYKGGLWVQLQDHIDLINEINAC